MPLTLCVLDIAAYPDSVNILPGVKGDLRTPDKLVDGVYDTEDGQHMWLAPVLPGMLNSVYVIFDEPCTVSEILLWNYAKTPSRCVKELAVSGMGHSTDVSTVNTPVSDTPLYRYCYTCS